MQKPFVKQTEDAVNNDTTFARVKRWMYRGQRPNWLARMANRAWALVAAAGLTAQSIVTLEVIGRKSGRLIAFPLVMAGVVGERYLVSMLGDNTQWVQNVRAAGGSAVLRSGGREEIQLEELPADQRPDLEGVPTARGSCMPPCAHRPGCTACRIRKDRGGLSGLPRGF